METNLTPYKANVFFQWTIVNTLVISVVLPITNMLYSINNTLLIAHNTQAQILINIFLVVVPSLLFGFFQWRILRSHIANIRLWIWVSLIGLVTGIAIIFSWNYLASSWVTPEIKIGLVAGIIIGSILGGSQWLVLRQHLKHSSLWIMANILGWSIGLEWSSHYLSSPGGDDGLGSIIYFAIFMFILAVTYSISTGILLTWLLAHPSKKLQATAA